MARAVLTSYTPLGGYPVTPLTALSAQVVLTDGNNGGNFVAIPSTGRELIVAYNTSGATPYTITIHSTTDERNRSGDITAYSLPFGTMAVFGPFPQKGWRQTDGNLWVDTSNAALVVGAIILPSF